MSSGQLPPSLSLNSSSGIISGSVPATVISASTRQPSFSFTIQATDSFGKIASQQFTIRVEGTYQCGGTVPTEPECQGYVDFILQATRLLTMILAGLRSQLSKALARTNNFRIILGLILLEFRC